RFEHGVLRPRARSHTIWWPCSGWRLRTLTSNRKVAAVGGTAMRGGAVPAWFDEGELETVRAACERVVPADPSTGAPGAARAGAAEYIDQLLGAFTFDPPRIWAGGPFSGRHGGTAAFDRWFPLRPLDELAWRTRIEGSLGRPERELNGPV